MKVLETLSKGKYMDILNIVYTSSSVPDPIAPLET